MSNSAPVTVRLQYAPIAALLLGIVLVRTAKRIRLLAVAAGLALAVGIFDAIAWDGVLFHSYVVNVHYNLILGAMRAGESPPWQYLEWLALAGGGLGVACIAGAAWRPRRYGLLLALIALTFPIIPCNLCGSQDGLERQRIKAMLAEWERESPGRTAQIFRAIRHVGPSHLADRELFDFEAL